MARVYSRGACHTCKKRKKKCDEAKPACIACLRLGLKCSYDDSKSGGPLTVACSRSKVQTAPEAIVRAPNTSKATSQTELGVVQRVQDAIVSFYTPATSGHTRDLSTLFAMMADDDLVHNAVVTCFSAVLGHTPDHGQLNRRAYGTTLQLLAKRLERPNVDGVDQFVLRVTMNLLGLLDCVGPEDVANGDPTRHWKALAELLMNSGLDITRELSPLNMQVLEAFVYNTSCLALFSDDVDTILALWQQTRIMQRMEAVNPEGADRIANSPLLSGEYGMYEVVLKVTCMHRAAAHSPPDLAKIRSMIANVYALDLANEIRFSQQSQDGITMQMQHAMREIYRCLTGALLVCLIALQDESRHNTAAINRIVAENLQRLVTFPMVSMCLAALIWPLEIFACTIEKQADSEVFEDVLAKFQVFLDPGHKRRLMAVVAKMRDVKSGSRNRALSRRGSGLSPIGLTLLRKPGGILS